MDYITVVGEIIKCGATAPKSEKQDGVFIYEFIEIKDSNNGEVVQTGQIAVTDNLQFLLAEGVKGTFVLGKSKQEKVVIGIKGRKAQATILEHASMNNVKGANVLKTMSTIGFVAAAFGLSQIWGGFDLSKSILLMIFGALLGTVTGVQPMLNKRFRKSQITLLTEAGFDMSSVSEDISDTANDVKK